MFSHRWAFDVSASVYDWLTEQSVWRTQIRKVLSYDTRETLPLRVLDLGCGPGGSTFVLGHDLGPNTQVVGIDFAVKMVQRARAHHQQHHSALNNVRFLREDATQLSFPDDHFDLIVGHSFLYLVADPVAVLKEVKRVLRPGGQVVLMEPKEGGSFRRGFKCQFELENAISNTSLETFKFWTSMGTWRVVSTLQGRWTNTRLNTVFAEAGLAVALHPTLGGMGLHCVGSSRVAP
jgi:ubiquinone/menaquinone biosynthesis C-methylase UbiE